MKRLSVRLSIVGLILAVGGYALVKSMGKTDDEDGVAVNAPAGEGEDGGEDEGQGVEGASKDSPPSGGTSKGDSGYKPGGYSGFNSKASFTTSDQTGGSGTDSSGTGTSGSYGGTSSGTGTGTGTGSYGTGSYSSGTQQSTTQDQSGASSGIPKPSIGGSTDTTGIPKPTITGTGTSTTGQEATGDSTKSTIPKPLIGLSGDNGAGGVPKPSITSISDTGTSGDTTGQSTYGDTKGKSDGSSTTGQATGGRYGSSSTGDASKAYSGSYSGGNGYSGGSYSAGSNTGSTTQQSIGDQNPADGGQGTSGRLTDSSTGQTTGTQSTTQTTGQTSGDSTGSTTDRSKQAYSGSYSGDTGTGTGQGTTGTGQGTGTGTGQGTGIGTGTEAGQGTTGTGAGTGSSSYSGTSGTGAYSRPNTTGADSSATEATGTGSYSGGTGSYSGGTGQGTGYSSGSSGYSTGQGTSGRSAAPAYSGASAALAVPGERALEGVQTPAMSIHKQAPAEVQVNQKATFKTIVRNVGESTAKSVRVTDRVPRGTKLVNTVPKAQEMPDGSLVWDLGDFKAGDGETLSMTVIPLQEGDIGSVATVDFQSQATAKTVCTKPMLAVKQVIARQVMIGRDVSIEIEVSNPGTGDATGVVIEEDVPAGLSHAAGKALEYDVGTLRPGDSKKVTLVMKAEQAGRIVNRLVAKADGGLRGESAEEIEVLAPQLRVSLQGPRIRYLNRPATIKMRIDNPGTASARNVDLQMRLPNGLKFVSADRQGEYSRQQHTILWRLEELLPGRADTVTIVLLPLETGGQSVKVLGQADNGIRESQEYQMNVDSISELTFTISDSADPIEVGTNTVYNIEIENRGTRAATKVSVAVELPQGLRPVDTGRGPSRPTIEGQRVFFPVISRINGGQKMSFQVTAAGTQRGDHVMRVQVQSAEVSKAVSKEEVTRVYDGQ